MKKTQTKPFFYWLLILFLLNTLYLVYEFAFNSRLVDVSVSQLTEAEIHAFELEGRFLSGVGLSLLFLRLITIQGKSFKAVSAKVVAAVLVAFPLMFFGQKILVDQMVDRTSAEQRLDAQYLMLMKQGLANNALQLEGIQFDEADLDSPHTKTFLSVLGLMTFVSPDFVDLLKTESDRIIDQVAENESNRALPEYYENYRKLQEVIADAWNNYQELSDAYWSEHASIVESSAESWNSIQQTLLQEWGALSSQHSEQNVTRSVLTLQRNLETYFEARERCEGSRIRDECLLKVEEVYSAEIHAQLGRYVAPTEWCHDPQTVAVTVQRRGRFVTEQRQLQECRNLSYDHLAAKLAVYNTQPTSYQEFIRSDQVSEQVRQQIQDDGLEMPAQWRANDRDTFVNRYIAYARAELKQAVDQSIEAEIGSPLPLDLNARQFVESAPIQQRLHEALQPLDPNLVIRLDWNPITFRDLIIKPHYLAHAEAERERLSGEALLFANGQQRAEEGKRYVRGLIVPPIAMGFSLFFGLLNAVGLLASVPLLLGIKSFWLGVVIKASGFAIIISMPMVYHSNVVKTDTYRYFESEASRVLTPVGSLFSTWVINTQPVIYELASVSARMVSPLFPADPRVVEMQRQGSRPTTIQTQPDISGQSARAHMESHQYEQPVRSSQTKTLTQIANINGNRPLYPQIDQYAQTETQGVMIDVQQLADQVWAVHREPVIDGTGTCLTNYPQAMQLSKLDSTQWRVARHGDCADLSSALRPAQIPLLTDLVRNFNRQAPDMQLWVHYQPSLLNEINCHSVRASADALAEQLGPDRLVAVVSHRETLSCFAAQQHTYSIAFIGPQYGTSGDDTSASHRHLNRAEVRRIRSRAQGEGYHQFASNIKVSYLAPITRQLREEDFLLLQPQHFSSDISSYLQSFSGNIGLYTGQPGNYEALIDIYKIIVIRE